MSLDQMTGAEPTSPLLFPPADPKAPVSTFMYIVSEEQDMSDMEPGLHELMQKYSNGVLDTSRCDTVVLCQCHLGFRPQSGYLTS